MKGKRIYNCRLSLVRRIVECAFGVLTNKFRVFQSPINFLREKNLVTLASRVLHSMIQEIKALFQTSMINLNHCRQTWMNQELYGL
jgi:hypothetical protein